MEHALDCVVLIGLAQVDQMRRAKSKNAELMADLDSCVQLLARSVVAMKATTMVQEESQ